MCKFSIFLIAAITVAQLFPAKRVNRYASTAEHHAAASAPVPTDSAAVATDEATLFGNATSWRPPEAVVASFTVRRPASTQAPARFPVRESVQGR